MQIISDPFIDPRLEIRYDENLNGWGVFTKKIIPAAQIVEVAPVIVYPRVLMEIAIWSCQAEGILSKDLVIDQYAVHWKNEGAIPQGWVSLYNHSDNNNAEFAADYDRKLIGILTLRQIQPNEQICVSYGQDWFNKKGYVSKIAI